MKKLFILFLLLISLLFSCKVSNDFDLSKEEANKFETIYDLVSPYNATVVEYFGPWCPRCLEIKDILTEFHKDNPTVKIFTINCEEDYNRKLVPFDFEFYPYIVIFQGDIPVFKKEGKMTLNELNENIIKATKKEIVYVKTN